MKHLQLSLITLLLVSLTLVQSTKVKTYRGKIGGYIGMFCKGFAMSLLGGKSFDSCFPAAWKTPAATMPSEEEKKFSAVEGPLGQILSFLGKAVDMACKFKKKILDWFMKTIKRRRTRRRMFLLAEKGELKVGEEIGLGRREGGMVTKIFGKAVAAFKALKQKITDFFKSPFVQNVIQACTCIAKQGSFGHAVKTIKGFIGKVKSIVTQGWAGVATVLVDCICNWKAFKTAIEKLMSAIKNKGDRRYDFLGQFVGQLVVAIGTA